MKMIISAIIFGVSAGVSLPVLSTSTSTPEILTGIGRATDGDSFRMDGMAIRLFGIDAVEGAQTCTYKGEAWACGRSARKALEKLIDGRTLTCTVQDMDRGRYVSTCVAGDVDINRMQVRNGWAVAYRQFSTRYVGDEAHARINEKGIWRSSFERPHDYRARLREEAIAARAPQVPPSTDCLIKGNISRSGTKIFHVPGQRDYQATRINERDGERWFCTPQSAEDAGWRAAKR